MTINQVHGAGLNYYLIAFTENGDERDDDPDAPNGRLSELALDVLEREPITDVFLMSHGWKGDIPAAEEQYQRWITAMSQCSQDMQRVRQERPGFKPLLIGLHWPSLPFGEEDFAVSMPAFDSPDQDPIKIMIDHAAATIVDTPRARQALQVIFTAAAQDIQPDKLPENVVKAYKVLNEETGLDSNGASGAPGDDREDFDPERTYQNALQDEAVSFGMPGFGGLLAPLQQLSFWKMKKRACQFGERGAAKLLHDLQKKVGSERDVRFHLMGHSLGSIVVSAAVAGTGQGNPPAPVHSLFLVQGALSLWSYCSDIPFAPGTPGYFHAVVRDKKVTGPIVTTQSEHDGAVGRVYPLAAGIKRQIDYAPGELPKYGAIGAFGTHGPGIDAQFLAMLPADEDYHFSNGNIYNLNGSEFICEGSGISGAHSDIAKPEVAHAFWSAVVA